MILMIILSYQGPLWAIQSLSYKILIIDWGITVGFKMDFHLKKSSK